MMLFPPPKQHSTLYSISYVIYMEKFISYKEHDKHVCPVLEMLNNKIMCF